MFCLVSSRKTWEDQFTGNKTFKLWICLECNELFSTLMLHKKEVFCFFQLLSTVLFPFLPSGKFITLANTHRKLTQYFYCYVGWILQLVEIFLCIFGEKRKQEGNEKFIDFCLQIVVILFNFSGLEKNIYFADGAEYQESLWNKKLDNKDFIIIH